MLQVGQWFTSDNLMTHSFNLNTHEAFWMRPEMSGTFGIGFYAVFYTRVKRGLSFNKYPQIKWNHLKQQLLDQSRYNHWKIEASKKENLCSYPTETG